MWAQVLAALAKAKRPSVSVSNGFHTLWSVKGHRIREQVSNDTIVVDALRVLLPPYDGNSLELYRGENRNRWNRMQLGIAWTKDKGIAEMFARGLNAIHGGYCFHSPSSCHSCQPRGYSNYIGEHEYVVDRRLLSKIICLAEYRNKLILAFSLKSLMAPLATVKFRAL
jgi:hypothetical protein